MYTPIPDIVREAERTFGRELTEREFERVFNTRDAASAERLHALWQANRAVKAQLACQSAAGLSASARCTAA